MPCPKDIKGIRSFLGHAGFYRKFIKDFSKIPRPLTNFFKRMFLLFLMMIVSRPLKFLRKLRFLHLLFNHLIGIYPLKLCVMLVTML